MAFGFGFGLPQSLTTLGTAFSPASLFAANEPGVWYDPSDITLGWRRNLLTYSEQFDNVVYIKDSAVVTPNVEIAPDGTLTADRLVATTRMYWFDNTGVLGSKIQSIFVKPETGTTVTITAVGGQSVVSGNTVSINLLTGSVTSGHVAPNVVVQAQSNGWLRIQILANVTTASGNSTYWQILSTPGILIWGAQLEAGTTATAYQKITDGVADYYTVQPLPVLYQDSAGTTPVTAIEQPVGLMLDKSRGLVLGSELVPDSGFDTPSAWTAENSAWVVSGGKATYTDPGSGVTYLQSNGGVTITSGKWYEVRFVVSGATTGSAAIILGVFNSTASINYLGAYQSYDTNGEKVIRFLAGASSTGIRIYGNNSGSSPSWSLESFSVRELPGNHASQSTSTSRPVLSARYNLLTRTEEFDNAAWTKTNATVTGNTTATTDPRGGNAADKLVENTALASHFVGASHENTSLGMTSKIYAKAAERNHICIHMSGSASRASASFNLTDGTVRATRVTGSFSGPIASIASVGNGWFLCSFTIGGQSISGTTPQFQVDDGTTALGDTGVSYTGDGTSGIYIFGADLRVANDGTGIPAYQRVTTATDYDDSAAWPRYLRFDGVDDSLSTASINFSATDKMTVFAGVRKLSDAAAGVVTETGVNYTVAGAFGVFAPDTTSSARYAFGVTGATGAQFDSTPANYAAPVTSVLQTSMNLSQLGYAGISGRVNAITVALGYTGAGVTTTGNFGNYPLHIGRRNNAEFPFNGRLFSLLVRGAATTDAQITATEKWVNGKTKAYAA